MWQQRHYRFEERFALAAWVATFWTAAERRRAWRPSAVAVASLIAASALLVLLVAPGPALNRALMGGGLGFALTTLGALPAFMAARISAKAEDTALGFAAGVMLAASAFSLLMPGIEVAQRDFSAAGGASVVVCAFLAGAGLMMVFEASVPHAHVHADAHRKIERHKRAWLLVFAIALHNLPEGMAVGVATSGPDWSVAAPVALAIGIQDAPEGLAVALALRSVGVRPGAAVLIAAATGVIEPFGAVLGVAASASAPIAYAIGLGLAAGAMVFVVSHEVIPETHRNGHQRFATIGLSIGFALMTVLDTSLG